MSLFARQYLLLLLVAGFSSLSLGGIFDPPAPLYSSSDLIVLLDVSTIKSTVLDSDKAWFVEFYSSWCGHCQHFAPTFKKLAKEVYGWTNVIGVAAIDCAQEANMPSCRDFEVMGYPSLKLIPPRAKMEHVGSFQDCQKKDVLGMRDEMTSFVTKIQKNSSYVNEARNWPVLVPFDAEEPARLWPTAQDNKGESPFAFVVYDDKESPASLDVLLSVSSAVTLKLPVHVPLRRIVRGQVSDPLLLKLGISSGGGGEQNLPQIVAYSRATGKSENITPTSSHSTADFVQACKDFVRREFKAPLLPENSKGLALGEKGDKDKNLPGALQFVAAASDIKRRRYTVYMADLERAILYSLSHEAAQHQVISADALSALQDYVDVLERYFPSAQRPRTHRFLRELRNWILRHDDAIRGEDLAKKMTSLKIQLSSFEDLPADWIGCRGSGANFGGYPCGLWTLWHTLTVNHATKAAAGTDARVVLKAMVGFIKHFFSCRECARHFMLEAEDGKAIDRDIHSTEDAMLWLWKVHNRVNQRLSGDITDDPVFPKEKYPSKEHCVACYDSMITGTNLWSEFRLKHVVSFLHAHYGKTGISTDQLTVGEETADKGPHLRHGKESVDRSNFERKNNNNGQDTWAFFSPADVRLCLSVYLLSAVILILVCLKFVAKRKFSSCISSLCPRHRSSSPYSGNPMLSRV